METKRESSTMVLMLITMDDSLLASVTQLRAFLEGSQKVNLVLPDLVAEKYALIDRTVDRLDYGNLRKKDKKVVISYLKKLTGYKSAQLFRLIQRGVLGRLEPIPYIRHQPHLIYTAADIKLLEETDRIHRRLNSVATKEILRREFEFYGQEEFKRISQISPAHINNLRRSEKYRSSWENRTHSLISPIGETIKPDHHGKPGSIRVDTVHQRGIYYINAVDELTQWEVIICVARLTHEYMERAVTLILAAFPFQVFNFHSDKGGEYLNWEVAMELNRQLIHQTKSRSYHCNDNALVEGKNGSVVRKNMGFSYIEKQLAEDVNEFCTNYLTPYVNYHRPCVYVTRIDIKPNGKRKSVYGAAMTPYQKLKQVMKVGTQYSRAGA